tara:strand:- start:1164 stop:1385 length:222 start_codon:yes stop_codon:yes gene_type:complete
MEGRVMSNRLKKAYLETNDLEKIKSLKAEIKLLFTADEIIECMKKVQGMDQSLRSQLCMALGMHQGLKNKEDK